MSKARADLTTGQLHLPVEVAVLLLEHAMATDRGAATSQPLREAGLMKGDRLGALPTAVVEVLIEPLMVVSIETAFVAEPASSATIWSSSRSAVIGELVDDHEVTLSLVEPTYLPFHAAHLVRLGERPAPAVRNRITVPAAAMVASRPAWDALDRMAAKIAATGVERRAASALALAHADRVGSWRITTTERHASNVRRDELMVLDGGVGGYWRLATDDEMRIGYEPHRWSALITMLDGVLRRR